MKCSMGVKVLVGMVCMMVLGCGIFEPGLQEETRIKYAKFVEGKMGQLLEKHARLVAQVQQRGLESERQRVLDATLDDLTKKGEEVQRQIKALQAAKGPDWLALQYGTNHALEELTQSYNKALARHAG